MAFWCILFMRVLMLDFGKKLFSKFICGVFMYSSSYSSCDGNEEVVEAPQKNLHRLSVTWKVSWEATAPAFSFKWMSRRKEPSVIRDVNRKVYWIAIFSTSYEVCYLHWWSDFKAIKQWPLALSVSNKLNVNGTTVCWNHSFDYIYGVCECELIKGLLRCVTSYNLEYCLRSRSRIIAGGGFWELDCW